MGLVLPPTVLRIFFCEAWAASHIAILSRSRTTMQTKYDFTKVRFGKPEFEFIDRAISRERGRIPLLKPGNEFYISAGTASVILCQPPKMAKEPGAHLLPSFLCSHLSPYPHIRLKSLDGWGKVADPADFFLCQLSLFML